jgi:hypothetical protein
MVKKVLYLYKKKSNEIRQITLDINDVKEEQELVKNLIDAKKNNKNLIIRQNDSNDSDFAYIDGEDLDDFIIKSNEITAFENPSYNSNDMDFLFNDNKPLVKPKTAKPKQKEITYDQPSINNEQTESESSLEKQTEDLNNLMESMDLDDKKLHKINQRAQQMNQYANSVHTYATDSSEGSQGSSYNSEQERQELEEKKSKLLELKQNIVGDN